MYAVIHVCGYKIRQMTLMWPIRLGRRSFVAIHLAELNNFGFGFGGFNACGGVGGVGLGLNRGDCRLLI